MKQTPQQEFSAIFDTFMAAQDKAVEASKYSAENGGFADTVSPMVCRLEKDCTAHKFEGLLGYAWKLSLVEEFSEAVELAKNAGYAVYVY